MKTISERHLFIKEQLYKNGFVTVQDLVEQLEVTGATIRRDLRIMESENLLRRSHGGASLVYDKVIELSLNDRSRTNTEAKARIAEVACQLLNENDSIAVTSGSTIEAFVGLLKPRTTTLKVVTPSIRLGVLLSEKMDVDFSKYAATELRSDEIVNEVLRGKVHDEKAYIMGGVAGHAGLFSCVEDISHFIEMILNDGVYKGKQFFSRATVDLLFTPQVKVPKGVSMDCTQRGLGWIVKGDFCGAGDLASPETIHHTGFTGTNVCIDRINKVGFSILSNRVHPSRSNTLIIPFRAKVGNYIIANFGGRNEY